MLPLARGLTKARGSHRRYARGEKSSTKNRRAWYLSSQWDTGLSNHVSNIKGASHHATAVFKHPGLVPANGNDLERAQRERLFCQHHDSTPCHACPSPHWSTYLSGTGIEQPALPNLGTKPHSLVRVQPKPKFSALRGLGGRSQSCVSFCAGWLSSPRPTTALPMTMTIGGRANSGMDVRLSEKPGKRYVHVFRPASHLVCGSDVHPQVL